MFLCIDVCTPLPSPTNGMINCSTPGNCDFACEVGFILSGSTNRLCQEDGTWTGTDTTCVQGNRLLCMDP